MPTILEVVGTIAGILACFVLLFVVQTVISPKLIVGVLSEADIQPCIQGRQWVIYDCLPNPLTGIGCVIPGSGKDGGYTTRKRIAINNPTCAALSDGTLPGDRVVSFQWQQQGDAGPCISDGTDPACCEYNETCTSLVNFTCERTSQPLGGENQCTPQFLPLHDVVPPYNSAHIIPVKQYVPCRTNFCKTI